MKNKFQPFSRVVHFQTSDSSSAKNSVCRGISNSSADTNDITVNKLREGGQSINIFSYLLKQDPFSLCKISL